MAREQKFNVEWEQKEKKKHKCCEHATMVNSMKRYRESSVVEDCELNGTSKCYNRNKIHNEWERIQNMLIARLANKIRVWKFDGTDQSKQDLYNMLDASVVALKA